MSGSDRKYVIGVGATACAVCCAGPIVGVLAAIGLTTLAAAMWFGFATLAMGATAATFVVLRRRRRIAACEPAGIEPVAVVLGRPPDR
jgi:hypothetical protein